MVTGGSGNIGRAIVSAFLARGAVVVIADSNGGAAIALADDCKAMGGRALAMTVDVSDAAKMEALVARSLAEFGRIDAFANNAGITQVGAAPMAEVDEALFDRILAINLKGVWLGMRSVIPAMECQGGGSTINISSTAGLVGTPGYGAYGAAKHGVIGLTRAAALEYGAKGIRINAVCPGMMASGMQQTSVRQDGREDIARVMQPALGRSIRPEEIAAAILYLASDSAQAMRGAARS